MLDEGRTVEEEKYGGEMRELIERDEKKGKEWHCWEKISDRNGGDEKYVGDMREAKEN